MGRQVTHQKKEAAAPSSKTNVRQSPSSTPAPPRSGPVHQPPDDAVESGADARHAPASERADGRRPGHHFAQVRVRPEAGARAHPMGRPVVSEDGEVKDEMRIPALPEPGRFDLGRRADVSRAEVSQAKVSGDSGSPVIQTHLKLGPSGDAYEQEADRVAEHVAKNVSELGDVSGGFDAGRMQAPASPESPPSGAPDPEAGALEAQLTRFESGRVEVPRISRLSTRSSQEQTVPQPLSTRIEQSKGRGAPLPPSLNLNMQAQLGHDFSGVRVKSDSESAEMCQSLNARAFTHGRDIWLGKGESVSNVPLLAHELTHVVQQGAAPALGARRTAQLARGAQRSKALRRLQALSRGGSDDMALYRKEILRFRRESAGAKVDGLQRDVIERPAGASINQRGDAQTLRACGGGGNTGGQTFPNMTTIAADATVERERAADWSAGLSDYRERAGWIMWDSSNSAFSVINKVTGTEDGVNPGATPPDAGTVFMVGHYHQHPPIRPGRPGTFPVGPSQADRDFANGRNSPGIVRDYTDTTRSTVTDYQYGPSRRA